MGYVLSILERVLFSIVGIINYVIVLITHIKKRGFFRVTNEHLFHEAFALDVFANYAYRATWNLILRKRNGYLFGNQYETISSALGKNQRFKTLTIFGWVIVYILWFLDFKYWFKGGHCINSIIE